VLVLAFAVSAPLLARRAWRLPPQLARGGVLAAQLGCVALLAFVWARQADTTDPLGWGRRIYFTVPTIAAAALLAAALALLLLRPRLGARLRALPCGPRARLACGALAVLATALWLLPALNSDHSVASAPFLLVHHFEFSFDETMAVLDGRSPLVDMATHGALVPYLSPARSRSREPRSPPSPRS
jgi:4-amino-4-deoxy-L-arabinose transferase-like glycosyltransferase